MHQMLYVTHSKFNHSFKVPHSDHKITDIYSKRNLIDVSVYDILKSTTRDSKNVTDSFS